MTLKEIEKIIKDFENSSLRQLELEFGEIKLKLSKNENNEQVIKNIEEVNENEQINIDPVINYPLHEIKSPLVGTFYAASSPDAKPYVTVGQSVKKGDTLCIIEAMKLMNEITSDVDGIVEKINFNNGDVVGYNNVVVLIREDGK